jgi:hypothetical protein
MTWFVLDEAAVGVGAQARRRRENSFGFFCGRDAGMTYPSDPMAEVLSLTS